MVDGMGSNSVPGSLEKLPQSDSKMAVGSKRQGEVLVEDSHASRKSVTMGDFQCGEEETEEPTVIVETQSSQVLDKNASENADLRDLKEGGKSSSLLVGHGVSLPLDLNTELCIDENSGYNDPVVSLGISKKHSCNTKGKASVVHNYMSLGGNRLDLNAEAVCSSANHDPFYANRSKNNPKMGEASKSGRTTGRAEGKDALKQWKEMKKNGFMSSAFGYGGIPAAPKQRGRKSKNEALKQRMEQGKKEQVDRFTKAAAPSGLLNGLNPGIINHVRNSKQVHSIIQALVKSENRENHRQAHETRAKHEQENVKKYEAHGLGPSHAVYPFNSMPERSLRHENHFSLNNSSLISSEDRSGCKDTGAEERSSSAKTSLFSYSKNNADDDILALKLASTSKISESTSCLSNEESANGTSVDTLSVKAATVASQWLQLLHQDIKGRLAALRSSKKRVRTVITTELPFLLAKEFPSNQENDPNVMNDSASGNSNKAKAQLHHSYWSKLFYQMDASLSEEEKKLESWFNQVNEMMLHCDEGLQHIHWNSIFEMQHMGLLDKNLRSRMNDPEKELSVRAAAASIYSTCNMISSQENVSCC